MHRRELLATAAALVATAECRTLFAEDAPQRQVVTVTGRVDASELGTTLPHEHVMVDFIGAAQVSPDRYDRHHVFRVVLPHLKQAKAAGCQTLVECTPAYLGRDPLLLKRLSEASGLRILTNTGYYGARDGQHLPQHAHMESADQLAKRWLSEWKDGIDGTGVRPGFIKIGVDQGPLSAVNQKLVQAAARTHLESGLTIACHTGDGKAAMEEMEILRKEGVDLSAWIWVHAQNEQNQALHVRAAEQGGWVEFDGIGPNSIDRHLEFVQKMKEHELLNRVLLSHDAGWYSVGDPEGGTFRSYTTLLNEFIPAMQQAGFSDREIEMLTVTNPAKAFAVGARHAR